MQTLASFAAAAAARFSARRRRRRHRRMSFACDDRRFCLDSSPRYARHLQ